MSEQHDFTTDQLTDAAMALRQAVTKELALHPSGKSRRTLGSWKAVAADTLGRKRLLDRSYKLVVDRAVKLGILAIETRSGRDYLIPSEPGEVPAGGVAKVPVERIVVGPEDAVEAPSSITGSPGKPGSVNPDPKTYCYCSVCGSFSGTDDPNDLYFDSRGVLCCNGCNDLIPPDLRGGVPADYVPGPVAIDRKREAFVDGEE